MAELSSNTVEEVPKTKRKRKTEFERLQEENASNQTTNTEGAEEDNPWTPRENLEVLTIHDASHTYGNAQQRADKLNDMMSRIRRTAHQPQKPKRSAFDFTAQVRALKKDGVELADLRAECFPAQEPPKKKKKVAAVKPKKAAVKKRKVPAKKGKGSSSK